MSPEPLNEREFELINIIGKRLNPNQRDLSEQLNLSLGQTNMLIRRMIAKGYIRISQLNQKKVMYLLTPKGMAEKLQKSVKYTVNTINAIGMIKKRVADILTQLHNDGHRHFHLYAEHDLAMIVEMVLNELKLENTNLAHLKDLPKQEVKGVLLIGKEKVPIDAVKAQHRMDLIVEMSKSI